jgi:predicted MFS family arabinose efflux permease
VLAIGGTATAVAVAGNAALGLAMGMLPVFLQAAAMRRGPNAHDPASALKRGRFNVGIAGGALLGGVSLDVLGPAALPWWPPRLVAVGLAAMAASRPVGRARKHCFARHFSLRHPCKTPV